MINLFCATICWAFIVFLLAIKDAREYKEYTIDHSFGGAIRFFIALSLAMSATTHMWVDLEAWDLTVITLFMFLFLGWFIFDLTFNLFDGRHLLSIGTTATIDKICTSIFEDAAPRTMFITKLLLIIITLVLLWIRLNHYEIL